MFLAFLLDCNINIGLGRLAKNLFTYSTVVCISLETSTVAKQVSVAVGLVKIKISLMAQLKGLTAKFKLM